LHRRASVDQPNGGVVGVVPVVPGDFRCVYANVEAGQAMRENVVEEARSLRDAKGHENGAWGTARGPAFSDQGMRTVLSQFALRASLTLATTPWSVSVARP